MNPNPFLGVVFHWIGGLAAAASTCLSRVKRWSWETYWLAGGFFSWIIAPWAGRLSDDQRPVCRLREMSGEQLFWPYFWGIMWGLGGLTFGLTMRYLGMSLGMGVALGYCSAFGTLMAPLNEKGTTFFTKELFGTFSGSVLLTGVAVCLAGIAVSCLAGMSKERKCPRKKKAAIKEFNFKKGILVATFSGILDALMAYGLAAGVVIYRATLRHALLDAARADGFSIPDPRRPAKSPRRQLSPSRRRSKIPPCRRRSPTSTHRPEDRECRPENRPVKPAPSHAQSTPPAATARDTWTAAPCGKVCRHW